jgi:hypothetical protein
MTCGEVGDRSLKIYDLTQTTNPVLLGSAGPDICDPDATVDLLWQGDLVIGVAADGLRVIDVRDPTAPILAAVVALSSPEWVRPVAGLRVLAGNDHEVHLIDLIDATDPSAPQIIASMTSLFDISDVRSVNDVVYVANGGGIWALDLPTLDVIGALAPQRDVSFLVSQADALWGVAPRAEGMPELPLHCGGSTVVADHTDLPTLAARVVVSPNPFTPNAMIQFAEPAGGHVKLGIFDLCGRQVRGLIDGEVAPGLQQVVWDGCSDDDRVLASGTYLVRLRTSTGMSTAKVTLMR